MGRKSKRSSAFAAGPLSLRISLHCAATHHPARGINRHEQLTQLSKEHMETSLIPVPQVAQRLGISPRTVWDLLRTGRLASVRVGGCRRVRSDELERFITELPTDRSPS